MNTYWTQCFDLCLEGLMALASMNWRGGFWYLILTALASLYHVRLTSTFTSCTHNGFSSFLKLSCSLSDTTREKTRQEKEGVDYHFVSFHMFEEDILNNRYGICRCPSWGFLTPDGKNSPTCVHSHFPSFFMRVMSAISSAGWLTFYTVFPVCVCPCF